jgi:hypothetical protein
MDTFFPTSTPAVAEELQTKINEQQRRIDAFSTQITRYIHKIQNVKEYITEVYQEVGEVPDELAEIARMLDIQLTKPIAGEATFTISWRAEVPIDFDPNDMDISFSVDCQSDVEDFDFDEIDTNIVGEEY